MYKDNMASPKATNGQPIVWFAKYFDNTLLEEFEEDGKENMFKNIDLGNLKEFGLYGGNVRMWFDTRDGMIHIFHPQIQIGLRFFIETTDHEMIKLCFRDDKYNDIIQYKHFTQFFNLAGQMFGVDEDGRSIPDQFFMGYKLKADTKNGDLNFTVRLMVNREDNSIHLLFHLAPKFDLDGHLLLFRNEDCMPTKISIEKDKSDDIDITISNGNKQ